MIAVCFYLTWDSLKSLAVFIKVSQTTWQNFFLSFNTVYVVEIPCSFHSSPALRVGGDALWPGDVHRILNWATSLPTYIHGITMHVWFIVKMSQKQGDPAGRRQELMLLLFSLSLQKVNTVRRALALNIYLFCSVDIRGVPSVFVSCGDQCREEG